MILRRLLAIAGFALFTSACGPLYSPTLPGPIIISSDTPTPTLTPTLNLAVSPTPSVGFTLVPTGSYFTLIRDSNCYNGPAETYLVVTILESGEKVDVIGRNNDSSWWRIVKSPSIDCWVANESGTFTGEFALIPITSSQYITEAVLPLSPTNERPIGATLNAGGSNPPTATNTPRPSVNTLIPATDTSRPATNTPPPAPSTARPTNTKPPATNPPTNPPPTNPPPTDPPATDPPPTDPPATEPPPI